MREKLADGGVFGGVEAGEFFLLLVEENDRGEAFDFVFLLVRGVFQGEGFIATGEIEFDEDEFFGGFFDELLLGEHLFPHHYAGGAPVGSGELDEDGFILGLAFGEGLVEVGHPAFSAG